VEVVFSKRFTAPVAQSLPVRGSGEDLTIVGTRTPSLWARMVLATVKLPLISPSRGTPLCGPDPLILQNRSVFSRQDG
jgi:hypothetical protein